MFDLENLSGAAAAALLFVALGGTVVMWWSWFAAIRASRGHPPFDELIGGRRYVGYEAISRMPDRARPYVRRHFFALVIFFLAPVVLVLVGA